MLENALDIGLTEEQFWNSTFAELGRMFASYRRKEMEAARQKATFDYKLADLIGRSVSRIYNSANNMPDIHEIYPNLFASKEIQEQRQTRKDELSALRFKLFADSFNKKFEEKETEKIE